MSDLRAVPARIVHGRRRRRRPRTRDRARVRGGQRRPGLGRVPRGSGCDVRPRPADRGSGRGDGVSAGPRILVVDDEPQILRALRTSLRAAGYVVETADTAQGALAEAAMRPPDAVILDLILPDGSGTDVCRELRTWSSAPVIVLSAVGDEHEKVAALDAGADDYVTKPVGIDELLARLRAVLRRVDAVRRAGARGRRPGGRSREAARHDRRRGGPPDAAPVRPPALPRRERGQAADAPRAPARGVGARLRRRVEPASTCTSRSSGARSSPIRARPRYLLTEPGAGYRLVDSATVASQPPER